MTRSPAPWKSQRPGRGWLAGAGMALALVLGAQTLPVASISEFKIREYYDAPHQSQLKAVLRSSDAVPEADGRIRIHNLKAETFRETGEREMLVEAPECLYDTKTREASSAGPIKGQTGDGRLQIEGTGFLLVMTNKTLTISNNVRTVIRDLGRPTPKP